MCLAKTLKVDHQKLIGGFYDLNKCKKKMTEKG